MNKEEKHNDELIRNLIKDAELKDTPDGLKERIMDEIFQTELKRKKTPTFLSTAWIMLFTSVALLPLLLNLISKYISSLSFDGISISTLSSNNLYYLVLILFSASLLLLAERLIKVSVGS